MTERGKIRVLKRAIRKALEELNTLSPCGAFNCYTLGAIEAQGTLQAALLKLEEAK